MNCSLISSNPLSHSRRTQSGKVLVCQVFAELLKAHCSNHCSNAKNAVPNPEIPPADDTKAMLKIVKAWGSLPDEIKMAMRTIVTQYLLNKQAPKPLKNRQST